MVLWVLWRAVIGQAKHRTHSAHTLHEYLSFLHWSRRRGLVSLRARRGGSTTGTALVALTPTARGAHEAEDARALVRVGLPQVVLGGVDAGLWGHGIGQRSRCAAMGSACVRARDAAEAHTLMDQKTGIVLLSRKLRQVWEFSDHMKYLYNATFVHLLLTYV